MLPLNCRGDKCQVLVRGPIPIVKQLRVHSHILINPKIDNSIESKVITWQNIEDLNTYKKSGPRTSSTTNQCSYSALGRLPSPWCKPTLTLRPQWRSLSVGVIGDANCK